MAGAGDESQWKIRNAKQTRASRVCCSVQQQRNIRRLGSEAEFIAQWNTHTAAAAAAAAATTAGHGPHTLKNKRKKFLFSFSFSSSTYIGAESSKAKKSKAKQRERESRGWCVMWGHRHEPTLSVKGANEWAREERPVKTCPPLTFSFPLKNEAVVPHPPPHPLLLLWCI